MQYSKKKKNILTINFDHFFLFQKCIFQMRAKTENIFFFAFWIDTKGAIVLKRQKILLFLVGLKLTIMTGQHFILLNTDLNGQCPFLQQHSAWTQQTVYMLRANFVCISMHTRMHYYRSNNNKISSNCSFGGGGSIYRLVLGEKINVKINNEIRLCVGGGLTIIMNHRHKNALRICIRWYDVENARYINIR